MDTPFLAKAQSASPQECKAAEEIGGWEIRERTCVIKKKTGGRSIRPNVSMSNGSRSRESASLYARKSKLPDSHEV